MGRNKHIWKLFFLQHLEGLLYRQWSVISEECEESTQVLKLSVCRSEMLQTGGVVFEPGEMSNNSRWQRRVQVSSTTAFAFFFKTKNNKKHLHGRDVGIYEIYLFYFAFLLLLFWDANGQRAETETEWTLMRTGVTRWERVCYCHHTLSSAAKLSQP